MELSTQRGRRLTAALWSSFLMAGVLEVLVFAVTDPLPLAARAGLTEMAVYSLAFLCFWAVTALAAGLALLLAAD